MVIGKVDIPTLRLRLTSLKTYVHLLLFEWVGSDVWLECALHGCWRWSLLLLLYVWCSVGMRFRII